VSWWQKRTSSGLYSAREDNRVRHTDNPAGRQYIRTNQWPTSIIPHFFTRRIPFLSPNWQCQLSVRQTMQRKRWTVMECFSRLFCFCPVDSHNFFSPLRASSSNHSQQPSQRSFVSHADCFGQCKVVWLEVIYDCHLCQPCNPMVSSREDPFEIL